MIVPFAVMFSVHRNARARDRAGAGIDRCDYHRARSLGRQRRRHCRRHHQPDRSGHAGPRDAAWRRGNSMRFRSWSPRSRLSRLSSALSAVGSVGRICVLAGRRRRPDAGRLVDCRTVHSPGVDGLVHRPSASPAKRKRLRHARSGALRVDGAVRASLLCRSSWRLLCPCRVGHHAIRPPAKADVSAQRAQSVPHLHEYAGWYGHIRNRG